MRAWGGEQDAGVHPAPHHLIPCDTALGRAMHLYNCCRCPSHKRRRIRAAGGAAACSSGLDREDNNASQSDSGERVVTNNALL